METCHQDVHLLVTFTHVFYDFKAMFKKKGFCFITTFHIITNFKFELKQKQVNYYYKKKLLYLVKYLPCNKSYKNISYKSLRNNY